MSQTTGKCVVDAPTTTTVSYWGTLYCWTATEELRACITKKTSAPFCALLNALGDVKQGWTWSIKKKKNIYTNVEFTV